MKNINARLAFPGLLIQRIMMWRLYRLVICWSLCLSPGALSAQTLPGILHGQVTDPSGAVIPGAVVSVIGSSGKAVSLKTNNEGSYIVKGLPAGKYTVRASAKGFTPFENKEVILSSGQEKTLDIPLVIAPIEEQEVVVSDQPTVDVDFTNNGTEGFRSGYAF
jgi:hypothetical protein